MAPTVYFKLLIMDTKLHHTIVTVLISELLLHEAHEVAQFMSCSNNAVSLRPYAYIHI